MMDPLKIKEEELEIADPLCEGASYSESSEADKLDKKLYVKTASGKSYSLFALLPNVQFQQYNYCCNICNKRFRLKNDVYMHVMNIHSEERQICNMCGKICRNNLALDEHRTHAHSNRRSSSAKKQLPMKKPPKEQRKTCKVVCQICNKTFSHNACLRRHMRVHNGVKPYNCKVCGNTFRQSNTYKQHLLTHTTVKPYVCDVCGRKFKQKPGLTMHRKTHPGPLPMLPPMSIDYVIKDFLMAGEQLCATEKPKIIKADHNQADV